MWDVNQWVVEVKRRARGLFDLNYVGCELEKDEAQAFYEELV